MFVYSALGSCWQVALHSTTDKTNERLSRILFEISIRYLLKMRLHILMPGQVSVCTVTSTASAPVGFTNYQVPRAKGMAIRTVGFHSIVMAPIAHFI